MDALFGAYHGDRMSVDVFLNQPHPLLEGETPFDMLMSHSGDTETVLNLIRRAEAGIAL